jgi:hypothetical protein
MSIDNSSSMKTGFSGLGAGVNAGHKKSSPTKTWIHSDDKMLDGVVYNVKVNTHGLA